MNDGKVFHLESTFGGAATSTRRTLLERATTHYGGGLYICCRLCRDACHSNSGFGYRSSTAHRALVTLTLTLTRTLPFLNCPSHLFLQPLRSQHRGCQPTSFAAIAAIAATSAWSPSTTQWSSGRYGEGGATRVEAQGDEGSSSCRT